MSKIVVSVLAILASEGVSWAQHAPDPGTLASDLRAASSGKDVVFRSDRNASGIPAKRVKAFSLAAARRAAVPAGYGLSLGRIKPMIDVRNDQLHYGR